MDISDLKTTYNVLSELDYSVPTDLLVHLAEKIRTAESTSRERRLARMSEEQLIRLESKKKRTIRIYLPDGRMIQKSGSEATYLEAIREVGAEQVAALAIREGRKDLILNDPTLKRRRIKGYYFIAPGFFLLRVRNTQDRYRILSRIDSLLRLHWDIELE